MRFNLPIAALLAAATLAGCSRNKAPAPADTARTRDEILALQKRFRTAMRSKDAAALAALMTPDFQQENADGSRMSREQVVAELRKTWPKIASVKEWKMDLGDVHTEGDSATADVHDRMTVLLVKPVDGRRTVSVEETTETTWRRTPEGWRYHRIAEQTEPGKPLAAAPSDGMAGGMHFVPVKQWAKDSRREQEAMRQAQVRREAARVKPVSKAPPGMTAAQARQMLSDLYARYRQAVRRKDLAGTLSFLTDDYTVQSGGSALPRWEVEKGLRTDFARTRSIDKWDMTIQDVAAHGSTLVVVLRENRSALVTDAQGQTRRVNSTDRMRDTWVKTPKGWKTQKTEIIPD